MKPFPGFPPKSGWTPLPNPFFTALLPEIDGLDELKVTLELFRLLYQKRGYPRFVTLGELAADGGLARGLEGGADGLQAALEKACARGTFLTLTVEREGRRHCLYFLNDPQGQQAVARIERGQLPLGELAAPAPAAEPPTGIFALYEENIGVITPLVAQELTEAEAHYPAAWIEEAFRKAVAQNKRRWSYIARILQGWEEEGRGEDRGDTEAKEARFARGKYGRVVRR